jgi:SseB protein N-terminal domain
VTEGENAASGAGAQDAAGAGAAPAGVPERGSGGRALHGGILGVADRFRDDDGSADPAAAAALSAFAAGTGSEHAALLALAAARLLVPVLAEAAPAPAAAGPLPGPAGGGEKSSDLALPTLVGQDGRRALPVFTSLEALARWQPSARPMPADSAQVWRAAAEDSAAVIIDVAGPVPLAVEGARLAALAQGAPVPPPHEDPDIQAAVETAITAALAALPDAALAPAGLRGTGAPVSGALVGFALHPGVDGGDLLIELTVAPMIDAQQLAGQVGPAVVQRLGSRLRRGVALALSPNPVHPA